MVSPRRREIRDHNPVASATLQFEENDRQRQENKQQQQQQHTAAVLVLAAGGRAPPHQLAVLRYHNQQQEELQQRQSHSNNEIPGAEQEDDHKQQNQTKQQQEQQSSTRKRFLQVLVEEEHRHQNQQQYPALATMRTADVTRDHQQHYHPSGTNKKYKTHQQSLSSSPSKTNHDATNSTAVEDTVSSRTVSDQTQARATVVVMESHLQQQPTTISTPPQDGFCYQHRHHHQYQEEEEQNVRSSVGGAGGARRISITSTSTSTAPPPSIHGIDNNSLSASSSPPPPNKCVDESRAPRGLACDTKGATTRRLATSTTAAVGIRSAQQTQHEVPAIGDSSSPPTDFRQQKKGQHSQHDCSSQEEQQAAGGPKVSTSVRTSPVLTKENKDCHDETKAVNLCHQKRNPALTVQNNKEEESPPRREQEDTGGLLASALDKFRTSQRRTYYLDPVTATTIACYNKFVSKWMNDGVADILENDILSGRGNHANKQPGNIKFRRIIESQKREYVFAGESSSKREIVAKILEKLMRLIPPARFLRKAVDNQAQQKNLWEIVDGDTAIRKIAQALRENAPTIKRNLLVSNNRIQDKKPAVKGRLTGDELMNDGDAVDSSMLVAIAASPDPSAEGEQYTEAARKQQEFFSTVGCGQNQQETVLVSVNNEEEGRRMENVDDSNDNNNSVMQQILINANGANRTTSVGSHTIPAYDVPSPCQYLLHQQPKPAAQYPLLVASAVAPIRMRELPQSTTNFIGDLQNTITLNHPAITSIQPKSPPPSDMTSAQGPHHTSRLYPLLQDVIASTKLASAPASKNLSFLHQSQPITDISPVHPPGVVHQQHDAALLTDTSEVNLARTQQQQHHLPIFGECEMMSSILTNTIAPISTQQRSIALMTSGDESISSEREGLFNYKFMTIKSSSAGTSLFRKQRINRMKSLRDDDKQIEMIQNIVSLSNDSDPCPLTAMFLIVRLSAEAFDKFIPKAPQGGGQEAKSLNSVVMKEASALQPTEQDIIINADTIHNHSGNLFLAELLHALQYGVDIRGSTKLKQSSPAQRQEDHLQHSVGQENQQEWQQDRHEDLTPPRNIALKRSTLSTTTDEKDAPVAAMIEHSIKILKEKGIRFLVQNDELSSSTYVKENQDTKIQSTTNWAIMHKEEDIYQLMRSLYYQCCEFLLTPSPDDFLFGGPYSTKLCRGNINFSLQIDTMRRQHTSLFESPVDRNEILSKFYRGGQRFLLYLEQTGMWMKLSEAAALECIEKEFFQ